MIPLSMMIIGYLYGSNPLINVPIILFEFFKSFTWPWFVNRMMVFNFDMFHTQLDLVPFFSGIWICDTLDFESWLVKFELVILVSFLLALTLAWHIHFENIEFVWKLELFKLLPFELFSSCFCVHCSIALHHVLHVVFGVWLLWHIILIWFTLLLSGVALCLVFTVDAYALSCGLCLCVHSVWSGSSCVLNWHLNLFFVESMKLHIVFIWV